MSLKKYLLTILLLASTNLVFADFPTSAVLDDFNRANEGPPPGPNWTTITSYGAFTGIEVASNKVVMDIYNTTDAMAYWNVTDFGPDSEAYMTVSAIGSNAFAIVGVRYTSTGNGYKIDWDSPTSRIRVWRDDAGTRTQLGSNITQSMSAGDSFGIQMIGSTITVWYKAAAGSWTSLGTRTDTTYNNIGHVQFGIWSTVAGATYDNFGGGNVRAGDTINDAVINNSNIN